MTVLFSLLNYVVHEIDFFKISPKKKKQLFFFPSLIQNVHILRVKGEWVGLRKRYFSIFKWAVLSLQPS